LLLFFVFQLFVLISLIFISYRYFLRVLVN